MESIQGKIAIVTGGASGIGKAAALRLAELGASVTVVDIDEKGGKETLQKIEENKGEAIFVKADVAAPSDVENYVHQTINTFGRIDLFFNNAGITGASRNLVDQPLEQIDKTIDLNLKGSIYGMKYVLAEMIKTGGGAIVNTSSGAGLGGDPGSSSYSASKHGIIGLSKTTALEYASENIRINVIAPGVIDTPMLQGQSPERKKALEESIPMDRLGTADETVDTIIYLLSSQSSYVTGVVIPVDGGMTAPE